MLKTLKSILLACCALCLITSCDTDTYTLGGSLINNMDHLEVSTGTFNLSTRTVVSDPVLARNTISYLGTVKDPETGEYISADYMTQFHTLENYTFPDKELMRSLDENGEIIADSCDLRLYFDNYYGDSLTTMKLAVYEMDRPMRQDETYFSDFDPKTNGLVRDNSVMANCAYTLYDMNVSESTRKSADYTKNIRIALNKPYTDKQGKTYNNYGSYIINKYYEDPTYFKNSIRLTNHVLPGLYVESTGGMGAMAYIKLSQINMYFKYRTAEKDSAMVGLASFAGTQEVMQHTRYVNDSDCLNTLAENQECTYLKTPSGLFTEITFPVEEITRNHQNDTINSAKFQLQRLNNNVESDYSFAPASRVLLIPADSLESFFINKEMANYKTSYLASYDSSKSTYTFNNVGSLIKAMQLAKANGETSENWNKALIIPVTVTTTTTSTGDTKIIGVSHDMSLTSTRLVGGQANPYDPIKLSVIYSKYE